MKLFIKISLLLLLPFFTKAQSQQNELDSLHIALKNAANDTIKMVTLNNLTSYYAESNRDSAMLFIEEAINIAKKINQQIWIADFLLLKSYIVQKQANFSLSLKLCNQAMEIVQDKKNEKNAFIPKEHEFASEPEKYRKSFMLDVFHQLGNTWSGAGNKEKAIEYYKKEILIADELNAKGGRVTSNMNIGSIFLGMDKLDSAFVYTSRALQNSNLTGQKSYLGLILRNIGIIYFKKSQSDSAKSYYRQSLLVNKKQNNVAGEIATHIAFAKLFQKLLQPDSMKYYANNALQLGTALKSPASISDATNLLSGAWKMKGNADSALFYLTVSKNTGDSLLKDLTGKLTQFQNANFDEQMRLEKEAQKSATFKSKVRTTALFIGLGVLSVLAIVFYRNNSQKQKANKILEKTLIDLKFTQSQLVQSEKMASLGELTAGIAHEIQNPLNFVNNFSDVSKELLDEMKEAMDKGDSEEAKEIMQDVINNLKKINHHGQRAGDIVKGMLQHSRTSTGQKELTDINELCDEYLRLSYHGLRAKDKSFNAKFETEFDPSLPKINVVPQEMGRVILNLINNAFYATNERKKLNELGYEPIVTVSTKKENDKVIISLIDNGTGIPKNIVDKIFQPFYTTKPAGSGTGLGLSLAYDIVTKGHGGELSVRTPSEKVESKEGEGTEFVILLPVL